MYRPFLFIYGFRLISVLVAVTVVLWVNHCDRAGLNGPFSRFLRHRDRIWFALLMLLVPWIAYRVVYLDLFGPSARPALFIVIFIYNIISGLVNGLAGCLFASPGKKRERFNVWIALAVAMVLNFFIWGLSYVLIFPRTPRANPVPILVIEGVLILSYGIWRAVQSREKPQVQVSENDGEKKERNPAVAFMWLSVGLAPIPLILILASSNPPSRVLGPLLFIVPVCNLCGGIGCLGGIKNIASRIILGIFLAIFFFCLTAAVAVYQACSHMGPI